jgi:hypothetical protein
MRTSRVVLLLMLFSSLGIAVSRLAARPSEASGAHLLHTQTSHSTGTLPVVVDGSKTPWKLPDQLAYQHFIRMTAIADDATAETRSRRDAYLARIGLSQSDLTAFNTALRGVKEQLEVLEARRQQRSPATESAKAERAALQLQEQQIAKDAVRRLKSELSVDGALGVDRFVREHVKSRIKIYGTPIE